MGVTNSRTRLSDFHFTTSSVVKNPPAMQEMQEMQVQSLSWEDPLENEIATHSSILAWKSHGQRSMVGYSPWGRKQSDTTAHTPSRDYGNGVLQPPEGSRKRISYF